MTLVLRPRGGPRERGGVVATAAPGRRSLPPSLVSLARWTARIYPFTLAGTILLVASVTLAVQGFTRSNVYTLLLGLGALTVLLLLAILGRLQAVRFQRVRVRWDTSQALVARRGGLGDRVIVERVRSFLFYRLHARIRARLEVGQDAFLSLHREAATAGGEETRIELDLPLPGTLRASATTAVRDVFGLTMSRFGGSHDTVRPVLPQGVQELEHLPISATGGNEEQNRKAQVDEEKYFMREYLPGDKARDINWKASSRLAQLITRISPYTQEKSRVIRIEIRPYRRPRPESLDSVMHLARMKARVVSFLRAVKHEHPEYSFDLACGEQRWSIRDEAEIESFARDLAALLYRPDTGLVASTPAAAAQLVIFTTPFDDRLASSLSSYGKIMLHIVTTSSPDPRKPGEASPEPLIRGLWDRPRLDHPLPGRWVFRRERHRSRLGGTLPAGLSGTVTEEPIAVRLLEDT